MAAVLVWTETDSVDVLESVKERKKEREREREVLRSREKSIGCFRISPLSQVSRDGARARRKSDNLLWLDGFMTIIGVVVQHGICANMTEET